RQWSERGLGDAGGDIVRDASDDGVGIADGEIAGRVAPGSPLIGLHWRSPRRGIGLAKIEGEAGTVVILVDAAALRRGGGTDGGNDGRCLHRWLGSRLPARPLAV